MAMNIYRSLGDWCHVVAVVALLHRLLFVKNAQGSFVDCANVTLVVALWICL